MSMAQPAFPPTLGHVTSQYDKVFERVGNPDLFLRLLIESGYRLYRVTMQRGPDQLVWAKPIVSLVGWERKETAWEGTGWYRQPIRWEGVPKTAAETPDLTALGPFVVDVAPENMRVLLSRGLLP